MDAKLNLSDVSSLLAEQVKSKGVKADAFTKYVFDIIIEGLEKDGVVKIAGLGTFKVADVASRNSIDVNTGEKIEIKGHKKLTFIPADTLKDKVNQPFAMFEPVEIDDTYVEEDATGDEEPAENKTDNLLEETINPDDAATDDEKTEEKEEISAACEDCVEPLPVEEEEKTENVYPLTEPEEEKEIAPQNKKSTILYILSTIVVIALLAISVPFAVDFLIRAKDTPANEQQLTKIAETQAVALPDTTTATDTLQVQEQPVEEQPYEFKMVEELKNKSVAAVAIGDTLLYTDEGSIATHIVVENETLTKIALKYFGDKKLWPYIVKHNKLSNPNGLCKGMELSIPRLIPVK